MHFSVGVAVLLVLIQIREYLNLCSLKPLFSITVNFLLWKTMEDVISKKKKKKRVNFMFWAKGKKKIKGGENGLLHPLI